MNMFERVSSDGHQMSLAGGQGLEVSPQVSCLGGGSRVRGRARGCALYSEVQWVWVMVIWHPLPKWTDRHI